MASKRLLKRDVNYVLGDIIDAAYLHQMTKPKEGAQERDAIVKDAIQAFDELILKINQKEVANKKQHFKGVRKELETKADFLVDRINTM